MVVLFAAFPWGLAARILSGRLGPAIGREVRIGGARRIDWLSFHPTVALDDVTVGQAAWAGRGPMLRIREVRIGFRALPILIGRFHPDRLDLDGVRAELRRDASGRANWEGEQRDAAPNRRLPGIAHLVLRDARLRLIDAKRHVTLVATVASDAAGLRIDGHGTQRGEPMTLALRGAPLSGVSRAPWPVRLTTRSPLAALDVRAVLDRPLALSNMSGRIVASGRDLTYLDDLLQAGLFPTQDFRIVGDLRRDGGRWRLTAMKAAIGRSRLTGSATIEDRGARTHIDATVDAETLDFGDLASDADRARGAARDRATGPRLIPDTRIVLSEGGVATLDGAVRLKVARLLGSPGSPFRALATTATLDDRRLTLDPLVVTLVSGRATGTATVDDRVGRPQLAIKASVAGARIEALITKTGSARGPLRLRVDLVGRGDTVRAAMAHASGHVGLAVNGGDTRKDYATFAGGDVFKSIGAAIGGTGPREPLRCLIGSFDVADGRLTPDPLVIDTPISRADGQGSITLGNEAIALRMVGRSKEPELLRSTTPVRLYGTLSEPRLDIKPPRAGSEHKSSTFARIGAFFKGLRAKGDGRRDAPAPDVDCAALTRKAVG